MTQLLPTVDFCGIRMTRLIIGGNPFSGNSHVSHELDEQMRDYYSTANIKQALHRCVACGINTVQLRADQHIMRILREFRQEGGQLNWIAQTASEVANFAGNIRQIAADPSAAAIYHHGSVTDNLYQAGRTGELRERLKIMRDAGLPVGLGTHKPEVIRLCEDEDWDVDFYMPASMTWHAPSVSAARSPALPMPASISATTTSRSCSKPSAARQSRPWRSRSWARPGAAPRRRM